LRKEIKTFDAYKSTLEGIWVSRFLRLLPDEFAIFARSYTKELYTMLDERSHLSAVTTKTKQRATSHNNLESTIGGTGQHRVFVIFQEVKQ
jgi:hypothetical protein